jgi:hypothetical protein
MAAMAMALVTAVPSFAADPAAPVATADPAAPAEAADPAAPIVRYDEDRLSVRVVEMPLAELLDRFADASGAAIRGTVPDRRVTATLDAVPLAEALTTLLGAHSFMLTYGSGGTLRTVELLATGMAVSPSPVATPEASATPGPLAEEEAQAKILQRTVRVSGALARAVESEQPSIGRLLHAAVRERRAGVRAEAREVLLTTLADDPDAEAAYLSTLTPVDDAVLAKILRTSSADDGAEAWMAALATRARSEELRRKAAAVLALLQQPPR